MRSFMSAFLLMTILGVAASARAQQRYGWVISPSSINPCLHHGTFDPGIVTLYLWYLYNSPDGLSAVDISATSIPPGAIVILGFTTENGFLNAGSATDLLLAVGGCPSGPTRAGAWVVQTTTPVWELCLGGKNVSVDCQIQPVAWNNDHVGFRNNTDHSFACCEMPNCACPPFAVEQDSWGSIKSLYH